MRDHDTTTRPPLILTRRTRLNLLRELKGAGPLPLAILFWLMEQADRQGRVESIDWYKLATCANVTERTAQRMLRHDNELVRRGIVRRTDRTLPGTSAKPLFEVIPPTMRSRNDE